MQGMNPIVNNAFWTDYIQMISLRSVKKMRGINPMGLSAPWADSKTSLMMFVNQCLFHSWKTLYKTQQENLEVIDLKPVTMKLGNFLAENKCIDDDRWNKKKTAPSPRPSTKVLGKQICMSGLNTAHWKYSNTTEDKFQGLVLDYTVHRNTSKHQKMYGKPPIWWCINIRPPPPPSQTSKPTTHSKIQWDIYSKFPILTEKHVPPFYQFFCFWFQPKQNYLFLCSYIIFLIHFGTHPSKTDE